MTARLLMQQHDIDKDPAAWRARRRQGLTASEMSVVLGLSPYDNPFALYVAKTTGLELGGDSDAAARGRHLEPYVAELFEGTHPDLDVYVGGLYCSEDTPWLMATFDRLSVDPATTAYAAIGQSADPLRLPDGAVMPVELKTAVSRRHHPDPDYHWGEPGTDQVPVHYKAQAMTEMAVAGARTVIIPCLFMDTWKLETYFIERTPDVDADLAFMRAEGERFLKRVEDRDPPPIDWTPQTSAALKALHPDLADREVTVPERLALDYRAALAANRAAERAKGLAANALLEAMGDAKYAYAEVDGERVKVVTRSQFPQKSTDVKALRAQFPAAAAATQRETPVDRLFPGGWAQREATP